MKSDFTEQEWEDMLGKLFRRFPSFQKDGVSAYKPGIENVEFFDQLAGHPHRQFKTIHVAGTNGKGSTSNMLASVLAGFGYKVGLYTSPHILDFRERMRTVSPDGLNYISKHEVWDFVRRWEPTFEHLDLSFFEITTMMAFCWFADSKVDMAVIETGLGGRLDTTNIITPVLSVITNIGLDHCDILGDTLGEIAFEKAGIIKPCVPVVVGESGAETDPVFERKTLYTNLPEISFMGDRNRIMAMLTFADKTEPSGWGRSERLLREMDLQGIYQKRNLRTVMACLDVLADNGIFPGVRDASGLETPDAVSVIDEAILHTARRMEFHGRWEKLSDHPYVLCDIGHNAHGLKYNFAQLESMMDSGEFTSLYVVYGSVSDKPVDGVLEMMPEKAVCVFTQADSHRALPAGTILAEYRKVRGGGNTADGPYVCESVADAVRFALDKAGTDGGSRPLVYIGGSTYVVSEAVEIFCKKMHKKFAE